MTNTILYLRVSNDQNGQSTSTSEQEAVLRAAADRHGLAVSRVIRDDDQSASAFARKKREGWPDLLAAVAGGECQYVGIWAQSRATRQLSEYALLRDLCEQNGVRWLTPSGILDLSDDGARLASGVTALVDEQRSRETSKAVKRTLSARAQAGRPHGRPVYGLRREYGPDGRLVAVTHVAEEVAILRELADRVERGDAMNAICVDLTKRKVPTPRQAVDARLGRPVKDAFWAPRGVRQLLVSPVYAGLRSHKGTLSEGMWEPVWTVERHHYLRGLLGGSTTPSRGPEVKHMLSGVLRCWRCGSGLLVHGGAKQVYGCRRTGCPGVSVRAARVEPLVADLVLRVLDDPSWQRDRRSDRLAAIGKEIHDLTTQREELERDWLANGGGVAALARMDASLADQIAALTAERAALSASAPKLDPDTIRASWDVLDASQRRHVVRTVLGQKIVVKAEGKTREVLPRLVFADLEERLHQIAG